jgi:hypothetical protein
MLTQKLALELFESEPLKVANRVWEVKGDWRIQ